MPNNLGGGPSDGYVRPQTVTNVRDSESAVMRRVLRSGWNTNYARGDVHGQAPVVGYFRAVNNLGDYLGRQYYACGGPNQVHADKPGWKSRIRSITGQCDNSGVPASNCNVRFVSDSSDYIRFKKQMACNRTYNDSKL